jgi:hypothetical protein
MGGAFSSAANVNEPRARRDGEPSAVPRARRRRSGDRRRQDGPLFNAQIESARLRFGLFTDDVDGLTKAVQKIDMTSAFNLADLSDAAALLGNSASKTSPTCSRPPRTPRQRPARARRR